MIKQGTFSIQGIDIYFEHDSNLEKVDEIVYLHSFQWLSYKEVLKVHRNLLFITIINNTWERDFTPFKHEAVFKGGTDFEGKAKDYASLFLSLVEDIEKRFPLHEKTKRFLLGYSLAGLFSLYLTSLTPLFENIACVSASFWYPGFLSFAKEKTFRTKKVYLSIGDRESQTKNIYLKEGYTSMKAIESLLEAKQIETHFDLNDGNHFEKIPLRIEKGLAWLLRKD